MVTKDKKTDEKEELEGNPTEEENPEVPPVLLDRDLQTIIDCKESPAMKAKMVRAAFAARDWPNPEHPGTPRDFMDEHSIPYYSFPKGDNLAERRQRVIAWEKEQKYGRLDNQA